MVQSSIKKKKLTIALVVVLTALIFCGVGLGVYFFIKGKDSDSGLTKNQIAFGAAIQSQRVDSVLSKKDFSSAYAGSIQNVVCFSDDYLAVSEDGDFSFISLSQNQSFSIDVEFDEVVSIFGKVAHLKNSHTSFLFDLENKKTLAEFSSSTISSSGDFILIKAQKDQTFTHFAEEQNNDVSVLVLSAKTLETVLEFSQDDDLVDVLFDGNFAFVFSLQKSQVYSLVEDFKKVLELENVGEKNSDKFNLRSSISSDTFFMSTYHSLSRLSSSVVLVEKTSTTTEDDCSIVLTSGGEDTFYKLEYNIFNTKTNSFVLLPSDDSVIKAEPCDVFDSYVAIVRSEIVNKNSISENQTIEYFLIDSAQLSKNTFKIEKLVSYDFVKFGKIVGYEKGKLLTKGGTMSGVIDFSGNQVSCLRSSAGETAESASWENSSIIFSSLVGLKGVKNSNGEVVFDAVYDKISPICGKNMIAKMGTKFFVLDTEKGVSEISNFATEFENYVFSGLGMYFTKAEDGKYNVYKIDKSVYKLSQNVKILRNKNSHMLCIGDDEIFEVEMSKAFDSQNLTIQKDVTTLVTNLKSFSGSVHAVATGDSLEFSSVDVDSVTGGGFATISKNFSSEALGGLSFVSFDDLTDSQKALVPTFDDEENKTFNANGNKYVFDGVHFESNSFVMIALIRLKNQATGKYVFMVNLALKNAYLKNATFSSSNGTTTSNFAWSNNSQKSTNAFLSDFVVSAPKLQGGVVFQNETSVSTTRTVDYVSSGFDGGLVFVSDEAVSFTMNVQISNIFVSENGTTGVLDFSDGETSFDFFKVVVVGKKVQIVANDGYAFTNATFFALSTNSIVDSVRTSVSTLSEFARSLTVDFSSFSESYFEISNIKIVEQYLKLNIEDFDGSEAKPQTVYYFYGYSNQDSTSRNPAPFGFENFERTTKVKTYTRDGYDFEGFFAPNSTTDCAIDSNGSFIGTSLMFETTNSGLIEFVMKPKYTPKKYEISYEVGGTRLPKTTEVTFDSQIGDGLLSEIDDVAGYNFNGWKYAENEITRETIYRYSQSITVVAILEAKKYVVNFDLNLSKYDNVTIKGFVYDISSVKLAENFGDKFEGDNVEGSLKKQVTFGEKFGDLPKLVGSDLNGKTYTFVCWSNQENFVESNGILTYGNQYTSETSVASNTIDPNLESITLFAHFIKLTYEISVVDDNQDMVEKSGTKIPHFKKIRVEGSTSNGVKENFSTITETGYSMISKNQNQTFETHSVQDESYALELFVGDGYYVSKITVKARNNEEVVVYLLKQNDNQTSSFPNVTNNNVSLEIDEGREVLKVLFAKVSSDVDGSTIVVETSPICFENTFEVTGIEMVKKEETVISENNGKLVDDGLIYASSNSYEIISSSSFVLNKVSLGGKIITFNVEYEEDSGVIYNVLTASVSPLSGSGKNDNIITKIYQLSDNAVLKVCYDILMENYSYFIETSQYENNLFKIEAKEVSNFVELKFENISEEVDRNVGITADGKLNGQVITEKISTGFKNQVLRDDKLVLTLKLSDFFLVDGNVVVKYGEQEYNVLSFSNLIDSMNRKINQTPIIIATDNWEKKTEDRMATLKGTDISVCVDESATELIFTIEKAYKDVSIKIYYQEYRFVQVEAQDMSSFDLAVLEGTGRLSTPEQKEQVDSDYNTYDYIIYKNESSIKSLQLKTLVTESVTYEIASSIGCLEDDSRTIAKIEFTEMNSAYVKVEKKKRKLQIKSAFCYGVDTDGNELYEDYLGSQIEGYHIDLSKVLSVTYTKNGESKTENNYSLIEFDGTSVLFAVEDCFIVVEATLKNENDVQISGDLDYNLQLSDGSEFIFEIQLRPKKFVVTFDLEGNLTDKNPSTSIEGYNTDSWGEKYAFFGIDFNIPDNSVIKRTGYILNGFDLSIDGEYNYIDKVEDDFGIEGEMTDETKITLYAIWSRNVYTISYQKNDVSVGNGSTEASDVQSNSVEFDGQFNDLPECSRFGYTFKGWSCKQEEFDEVKNSSTLDKTLLEKLSEGAYGAILLYAHWEAKEVTVTIDVNTTENGSTEISGEAPQPINVLFDEENGLILPSCSRLGYDLLGYDFAKLKSDEVDISGEFLKGQTTVDNSWKEKGLSDSLEITINAVWKAKTVKAIVNTNENSLVGRNDLNSGLSLDVSGAEGSNEDGYFVSVTFDKSFGTLPTITADGYKFLGLFPKGENEEDDKITSETMINKLFVEKYYSNTFEDFTLDASYEIENYQHEDQTDEHVTLRGNLQTEFYGSLDLTFKAEPDYHIKTVTISGANQEITLKFKWNKAEMKIELDQENSPDLSSSTSLYKEIMCEINEDDLVLTIKNVKRKLSISTTSDTKTIDVSFYINADGGAYDNFNYLTKEYNLRGGKVVLCQKDILENVDYPFLLGYKFVEFRIGTEHPENVVSPIEGENGVIPKDGESLSVSQNTIIVACYESSSSQGVHFFFYDNDSEKYVEHFVDEYKVYPNGNSGKFDLEPFEEDGKINKLAGKVRDLPSIGSSLWPKEESSRVAVFCGFIISNSAPTSGYFKKSDTMTEFSWSTKIEGEINVYAVYDVQKFTITNVRAGETLQSECNLYCQDIDGVYTKIDASSVKYIKISMDDFEDFTGYVDAGDTREVALKKVTGTEVETCDGEGVYFAVVFGTNDSYYCISENEFSV